METVFLGTYGAVPAAENGNTSFLIATGKVLILVDTSGNPLQSILCSGKNPDNLEVVILTHAHVDHLYGLPSLIHGLYWMDRSKALIILSDPSTRERAEQLLSSFGLSSEKTGFPLDFKETLYSDDFKVDLFPGSHSVPSSMVKIEADASSLMYTSDTSSIEEICRASLGCSTLIHEASGGHNNIEKLIKDGHSSAYQAGQNAACAGVKQLFLCHFSASESASPESMKTEAGLSFKGEIIIPEPFKSYSV